VKIDKDILISADIEDIVDGTVIIPENITKIKYMAFYRKELEKITIPGNITEIGRDAFSNNKITKIIIPDSVTKIEANAFSFNGITEAVIPSNMKSIPSRLFCVNKLKTITIPDSVTNIEYGALQSNELTNVIIPNMVTKIEGQAFMSNKLKNIIIPDGVTTIGELAFASNQLSNIDIPKTVTNIGPGAFNENKFSDRKAFIYQRDENGNDTSTLISYAGSRKVKVKIPSNVTIIGDKAFAKTILTSIDIPKSVTSIGNEAFSYNYLDKIVIPSSVTTIGDSAFILNSFKTLVIPNSVTNIGKYAFRSNKLKDVTIPDSISVINSNTFQGNKLKKIKLPKNITSIESSAFETNRLINIEIPDGINNIGVNAFADNQLVSINIPESIKSLANNAFQKNPNLKKIRFGKAEIDNLTKIEYIELINEKIIVLYNDKKDYVMLDKKGIISKINVNEINEMFLDINNVLESNRIDLLMEWRNIFTSKNGEIDKEILRKLYSEIILNLPINRENANLIKQGIKNYKHIKEVSKFKNYEENRDLFKMCYSLGLFSGEKEHAKYIIDFIENKFLDKSLNEDLIHKIFDTFKIDKEYNKDKALLIINSLNDPYFTNKKDNISRINNEYEEIKKYLAKEYKEIIGRDINVRIRELTNNEKLSSKEKAELKELQDQLIQYQKSINKPRLNDVKFYIENNRFLIRPGNESLQSVIKDLSGINQDLFDNLQDIYQQSRGIKKEIMQTKDNNQSGYTYQWSASDNPTNLVLGYIVECCAKIKGAGEDIMIQSMINPFVQNLIIRDENQNIVGKSTVYYNKSENYMLFNNVEAIKSIDKKQSFDTLKRAVIDQVAALKQSNIELKEIRIGMLRNDLLSENDLDVVKINLLPNYKYENYSGDANNSDYGQGILYKSK
jgi:hypothetical protein